jgi:general stress protein YciG
MENQDRPSGRSLRGFASMDKEKQKAIASKGGRAAHEKGTAHEFNSSEASMAAKKGHERGTAHEFTPEEARVAGRKGGLARAQNRSSKSSDGEMTESEGVSMSSYFHNPSESSMGSESSSSSHNPA